jgi:hypothetical protein
MKHLFKILSLAALMLVATGCDRNFDEINTDRNVPTKVTPDLLLAGILRSTINSQVSEAWAIGNIVAQHTAKIQFVNEDRYLWGERAGLWNTLYGSLRNIQNMITFAEATKPVQNNYLGIALILKSWHFALLTDTYGDVPYTQAIKAKTDGIFVTDYDPQEVIYDGILADLRRANELLGTSAEVVAGDILYGGGAASIMRWRRFANSLRLRYLLRLSGRRDVSAQMQEIVGNSTQFPIFTSNADQAALTYLAAAPNQWPLFETRVGSFDEFRLSQTLGNRLAAMNDPRLAVFARPTLASVAAGNPVIVGVPNGLEDTQALSFNGGPQHVSRVGLTFACLVCVDAGQPAPVPNAARGLVMTFAELQFILAEARQRNLITTGSAETYYLAGINANFDFYRAIVPAAYNINLALPPGYLTQSAVAYTGTNAELLDKIATQKWIALFFNGLEAWFDWRRTGLPVLRPGPANLNNDRIPVRYLYPMVEAILNGEGRSAAVARQGPDDINTRVWWDVN